MSSLLQTKIEYLQGVGPNKALLLQQELQLFTFEDFVQYYPFRYQDRSQLHTIEALQKSAAYSYVQLRGTLCHIKTIQSGKKRLLAQFRDNTGAITLLWFKGLHWVLKKLQLGVVYTVFGKLTFYGQQMSLVHPDLEVFIPEQENVLSLLPVYHTTEKLKAKYIDSNALARLQRNLLEKIAYHIPETLPSSLLQRYKFVGKSEALLNIHFPKDHDSLHKARLRLKFEELFYLQLRLLQLKQVRLEKRSGRVLHDTQLLRNFYTTGLPFILTGAQKRVVKEIYQDFRSGKQMNRLVQGDVGSGKTMVAFLSMLICLGSGAQVAMMAPTELLAEQHYQELQALVQPMNIIITLLTGATKKQKRDAILASLQTSVPQIVIGTHALLSTTVNFNNLGLAIIDEQHRFGVAQRAKLWTQRQAYFPHVLVMTATPIPRTLALTCYGDLDVSVIDEMPVGRKSIKTIHYYDAQRLKVFQLLRKQIVAGRQAYIVYPLIEESEKLDYKNLIDGYESICRAFPEFPISIVHGRMHAADKAYEMQRFTKGETKLMVATTVIEVGVNVPNATVMVIENAERFGLAQLHQLRGRVGRGNEQAYCILMTSTELNNKSRERLRTMVRTNDGFEIADADLQLRGPGDLLGVQQSGALDLKIADLAQDNKVLQEARTAAQHILKEDPTLTKPQNLPIQTQLEHIRNHSVPWSSIS
jgi:ATP-dependent DNA helicase RecG